MRAWGALLVLLCTLGCEPLSGVRRAARVDRTVDLGCVMSILESTPGVSDVHFSVLHPVDDATSLVHSFYVEYAGTRGALQIVDVRGTGQLVQQLVLRAAGGIDQTAVDRARPLMLRIERRMGTLCHVHWTEEVSETCTHVDCPTISDLPVAPSPDSDVQPALTMLDVA